MVGYKNATELKNKLIKSHDCACVAYHCYTTAHLLFNHKTICHMAECTYVYQYNEQSNKERLLNTFL